MSSRKISQRCRVNSRWIRLVWLIREVGIWKNFLRNRMRVVSNYERAKFTRKARGANNFRRSPRFACLLIFAERVDSSCCYFPPKWKITRTLSTTVQFRKTINLAFRRGESTAPNTQDQYPCYQDEEKQLTKGPTSFPGLSPLREGGRENKLEKNSRTSKQSRDFSPLYQSWSSQQQHHRIYWSG